MDKNKKIPTGDDFKKLFGKDFNIDAIKEGIDSMINKVNPQFEKIIAEQRKLSMPKSKKNINFNGAQCSVSLIEDGRIIIQSPSQDHVEAAYIHLDNFCPKRFELLTEKCLHSEKRIDFLITDLEARKKRASDTESKWWYKFFNYFS